MKIKQIMTILFFFLSFVLTSCTVQSNQVTEMPVDDSELIPESNIESVNTAFLNNESFLLVFGSSYCSACVYYREHTLPKSGEIDGLKIFFIFTNNQFEPSELSDFLALHGLTYQYSPTTYLVENGLLSNYTVGAIDYDALLAFIQS